MSLAFRLGTVAFTYAMMALALYILTAGILGRRIHWKSLGIFFVCAEVLQWMALLLYGVYNLGLGQEDIPSAVFDAVCYVLTALILGKLMTRVHRIPLLYTFTAAILCIKAKHRVGRGTGEPLLIGDEQGEEPGQGQLLAAHQIGGVVPLFHAAEHPPEQLCPGGNRQEEEQVWRRCGCWKMKN